MRWLITGGRGQLGSDLLRTLTPDIESGVDDVLAPSSATLDVTDTAAVGAALVQFAPDVIVNAAAYTAVDQAETDADNAYRVNATGPAILATAAARSGARLIQVSTDYVFAGDGRRPYLTDDAPAPRSVYGRTKLAGEQAVRELLPDASYVVRTAWVYGASGTNFVKTMARLEGEHDTITVVDDQRGSPTWSADLARGLVALGRSDAPAGMYHCTGSGETTWRGFAQAIFTELGADPERVLPTSTDAFPRPAPRPAYSVLSTQAWDEAGLPPMPHWRAALHAAFAAAPDAFRVA